jgi:hypothetical protein
MPLFGLEVPVHRDFSTPDWSGTTAELSPTQKARTTEAGALPDFVLEAL